MSNSPHYIVAIDVHETFNDSQKPWDSHRIGKVVPSHIAVFEPLPEATQLTSKRIQGIWRVQKATIVHDCLRNVSLVFLCNKNSVQIVVEKAFKLPEYRISPLDQSPHCADITLRLKEWIRIQAPPDTQEEDEPDPMPKVLDDEDLKGLIALSDEDSNDIRAAHAKAPVHSRDASEFRSPLPATLEGPNAAHHHHPTGIPSLDNDSATSDEEEEEFSPPFISLTTRKSHASTTERSRFGKMTFTTTAEAIASSADNPCARHNREVFNILLTLATTGPEEVWNNDQIQELLSRDPLKDSYDVELEQALLQAMTDAREIQLATGNAALLVDTLSALATAWRNLNLGPLSDIRDDE